MTAWKKGTEYKDSDGRVLWYLPEEEYHKIGFLVVPRSMLPYIYFRELDVPDVVEGVSHAP